MSKNNNLLWIYENKEQAKNANHFIKRDVPFLTEQVHNCICFNISICTNTGYMLQFNILHCFCSHLTTYVDTRPIAVMTTWST